MNTLNLVRPEIACVRVVHGGDDFHRAVRVDTKVVAKIAARNELAPLHNANAIKVVRGLRQHSRNLPVACVFDTAFHMIIPEVAWRYRKDPNDAFAGSHSGGRRAAILYGLIEQRG